MIIYHLLQISLLNPGWSIPFKIKLIELSGRELLHCPLRDSRYAKGIDYICFSVWLVLIKSI